MPWSPRAPLHVGVSRWTRSRGDSTNYHLTPASRRSAPASMHRLELTINRLCTVCWRFCAPRCIIDGRDVRWQPLPVCFEIPTSQTQTVSTYKPLRVYTGQTSSMDVCILTLLQSWTWIGSIHGLDWVRWLQSSVFSFIYFLYWQLINVDAVTP